MSELPKRMLGRTGLQVTTLGYGAMELRGAPGGPEVSDQAAKKVLNADGAEKLNIRLQRDWPEIRRAITAVVRPSEALEATLKAAKAPTRSEEIHVPAAFYRQAVRHAREIRERYTFLDLATDAGRLDLLARAA